MGRSIAPEIKSAVIEDYGSGDYTYQQLAEKHKISIPTISSWLSKSKSLPAEMVEDETLQKELQRLENRFPGILERIKSGELGFNVERVVKLK